MTGYHINWVKFLSFFDWPLFHIRLNALSKDIDVQEKRKLQRSHTQSLYKSWLISIVWKIKQTHEFGKGVFLILILLVESM